MVETTPADLRSEGFSALGRGDFIAARGAFAKALLAEESADAHQMLAGVCLILEDLEVARHHGETAYRRHREAGDRPRAAAAAILLAALHGWWGNDAAIGGWLARAQRLLDDAGPCVERGYLEMGRLGCEVRDVTALEASADAALEVAHEFGDTDLEVRALADGGLALVSQGRIAEGMARLDEAMTAVVAGEVRNQVMAGMAFCAMLHACDRAGDLERATQWCDAALGAARARFGEPPPNVMSSHCRIAYGRLLCEAGRWEEAGAEMARAIECTRYLPKRAEASARLADLRIRQGRLAEAAEVIAGLEDRIEVAETLARLHLARQELDLGAAALRRTLREQRTNRLACAPLLCLLVEVELGRGDAPAASGAAAELRCIAEDCDAPAVWTLSELSAGRIAAAAGEDGAAHFHAALERLPCGQRPVLHAEIQLELAGSLRVSDPAAAVAEARAALAVFERLGARRAADRATGLLRAMGVSARVAAGGLDAQQLSRREREVLSLLAEGLSNPAIAKRLFITTKTAEHHVGAILGKLNLRSRAEAAAYATSQRDR